MVYKETHDAPVLIIVMIEVNTSRVTGQGEVCI